VYEAIAHVISAMSMEQAATSLRTFALDILTSIHSASVQPTAVSKEQFKQLCSTWSPGFSSKSANSWSLKIHWNAWKPCFL